MSTHKSVIEQMELTSGTEAYVQISEVRVHLSFDGSDVSMGVTMTLEELQEYSDLIQKALEQSR